MAMVTVAEAAALLGVGTQRVRDLYREGALMGEKRLVRDRGYREAILLDADAVEEYRRTRLGKPGGWRERDPESVQEEMRSRGYLTTAEAADESIGLTANYLAKLVRRGQIAGERRNVTWIHRDEIERLKREREEKLARAEEVEGAEATYW